MKFKALIIASLLPLSSANAALIQMDFSVGKFGSGWPGDLVSPVESISGSISWTADSIDSDIQQLVAIHEKGVGVH